MWKRTVGLRCFVAVEHVFKMILSDKVALINSDSCILVPLSQINEFLCTSRERERATSQKLVISFWKSEFIIAALLVAVTLILRNPREFAIVLAPVCGLISSVPWCKRFILELQDGKKKMSPIVASYWHKSKWNACRPKSNRSSVVDNGAQVVMYTKLVLGKGPSFPRKLPHFFNMRSCLSKGKQSILK